MAQDPTDAIARQARPLFVLNGIAFFVWMTANGAEFAGLVPDDIRGAAFLASGIGVGLWIVTLILIIGVTWRAKAMGVFDRLSDEWALRARSKAAELGFWVLVTGAAIFQALSNFGVDGGFLLKVLLGLGVASFLIAYARFEGAGDGPEEDVA